MMCLTIGTPKIVNFPFRTNEKLMVLGVPILKHFKVSCFYPHYNKILYDCSCCLLFTVSYLLQH